jgi:hypothetical protein
VYTEHDSATLSAALHDFPLSDLGSACRNRVDVLHDLTKSTSMQKDVTWSVQTDKATFLVLTYASCVNHAQWFVRNEARHLVHVCKRRKLGSAERLRATRLQDPSRVSAKSCLCRLPK